MNLFLVAVTVVVIVSVDAGPVEYYATKYDHLDIEEILNNRRMVKYYANCLLYKGPCPPQGLELRKILPEALETNCLRCTEKQKVVTYQSIKRLKKEYPKTWALLEAQWDPKNVYVKRFEESFKNTPSTVPPENEIIIEDRFGDPDATIKPSTTKKPTPKTTKKMTTTTSTTTSTPPTTRTSRIPSINSIASASEKKPSSVPQSNQNGGNVANQVGTPSKKDDTGNKKQISSSSVSLGSSTTSKIPPSPTPSLLTPNTLHLSPGLTFDIPQSSMNHPQTKKLLQTNVTSTINPQTTTKPSSPVPKRNRQPTTQFDPISQLVSSFLNANRPSTSRTTTSTTESAPVSPNLLIRLPKISGLVRKAGHRNRAKLETNATVSISLSRPVVQVRLPGLTVNNQIEGFRPVGNLVRGLANAGDRLLVTGTSIADSVLTSVRGLFTPQARKNRALRRS